MRVARSLMAPVLAAILTASPAAGHELLTAMDCRGQSTINFNHYVWRFGRNEFEMWDDFGQKWVPIPTIPPP